MRAPLCSQEVGELLLVEAEVEEVEVTRTSLWRRGDSQYFRRYPAHMLCSVLGRKDLGKAANIFPQRVQDTS